MTDFTVKENHHNLDGNAGDKNSANTIDPQKMREILGYLREHFHSANNKPADTSPTHLDFATDYIEHQWEKSKPPHPSISDSYLAHSKLQDTISSEFGEADRQHIQRAQDAILRGDPRDASAALKDYKDDPEKLKAVLGELSDNFKRNGAHVRVTAENGSVNVQSSINGNELEVSLNLKNGTSSGMFSTLGRASFDGSMEKNPAEVMRRIGDQAVINTTMRATERSE